MNETSFLFTYCDFHLSYAGCVNINTMVYVNTVFIGLAAVSILLYLAYPLWHLLHCLAHSKKYTPLSLDFIGYGYSIHHVFSLIMLCYLKSISTYDRTTMTNSDIESLVRGTIYIELCKNVAGTLSSGMFVLYIVQTTTGTNLYEPVSVLGVTVNAEKGVKYLRLFLMLLMAAFYSLLAWSGTKSRSDFVLYRRLCFFEMGAVGLLIQPTILFYFGHRVIVTLKASLTAKKDKHSRRKIALLERTVYSVIFGLFLPLSFIMIVYPILCEMYQDPAHHVYLLLAKIVIYSVVWVCNTGLSFYLLQKTWSGIKSSNASGSFRLRSQPSNAVLAEGEKRIEMTNPLSAESTKKPP
ncbi:hypothetical protein HDV03_005033 [Kappamyces sp. JEL0829]|nr:hypothetical protein HDV03_005033 [Kappamyces sp. JEL0829]